ncbi:hypothetical protein Tco_0577695 [Tanacetum coccineum]
MMQVWFKSALARELLWFADVNRGKTFIKRMTAVKERKKRALATLRYRASQGKPLKKSEVTQLMRNLVKNQWCAAHNGTITMKEVKTLNQKYSNPAGSAFGAPVTDSTVTTPAAKILLVPHTSADGISRGAADPDDEMKCFAEIIFLRVSLNFGDGVLLVDRLPDDEIGIHGLSGKLSESESDDDMENYIPPLPYGEFQDWEMEYSFFATRMNRQSRLAYGNPMNILHLLLGGWRGVGWIADMGYDEMFLRIVLYLHEIFISADGIKSFLLIMFLLVMFSFLLTEIESAGHVLVSADRDRIC